MPDDLCRWCNNASENTHHLLAGCPKLNQTEYTNRHDNMGKILHQAIENKIFNTTPNREQWKYIPEAVKETADNVLYWNRSIHTDRTVGHNRPDTTLWKKRESTVHLVDYAIVNSHNLQSTYNEKIQKYQNLAQEIKKTWQVENVKIHPIVISTTGIVPKSVSKHLKELDLPQHLIDKMQHSLILSDCNLFRKTLYFPYL